MTDTLHVVVTPDADAARILRRQIAEKGLGFGVVVTTIGGVIDLTRSERLLPDIDDAPHVVFQSRGTGYHGPARADPCADAVEVADKADPLEIFGLLDVPAGS